LLMKMVKLELRLLKLDKELLNVLMDLLYFVLTNNNQLRVPLELLLKESALMISHQNVMMESFQTHAEMAKPHRNPKK